MTADFICPSVIGVDLVTTAWPEKLHMNVCMMQRSGASMFSSSFTKSV